MPSGGWEARFLYSEKRRLCATEEAIMAWERNRGFWREVDGKRGKCDLLSSCEVSLWSGYLRCN